MAWSSTQQTALAVLPKVSSLFSLCGSTWIVIEVLWGKVPDNQSGRTSSRSLQHHDKFKRRHPYHRLLLAMSVYDILESIWNFLSTWPLPVDTPSEAASFLQPVGSRQSCTAQGFFLQFAVAIPIYNAFLSLYYLLVINYRCSDTYIKKWIEPSMHVFAFGWAFGTSLVASTMGYMNNANLWCWIASYPSDCLAEDNDIECTRGQHTFLMRWVCYFGILWGSILAASKLVESTKTTDFPKVPYLVVSLSMAAVCTLMVYWYVRKMDIRSLKYRTFSDESNLVSGFSQQSSRHLDLSGQDDYSGMAQTRNVMNCNDDNNSQVDLVSSDDEITPPPRPHVFREPSNGCSPLDAEKTEVDSEDQRQRPVDLRQLLTKERVSFLGASVRFGGSSSWGQSDDSNRGNNVGEEDNRRGRDNSTDISIADRKQRFLERWRKRQAQVRRMHQRTIEVFHQAVFYLGAFILTHIFSTTNRIVQHLNGGNTIFGLVLMHSFFDPFQGFTNFVCYQRPRYLRERKHYPELGRWGAVRRVLRFSFLPEEEHQSPPQLPPSSRPQDPELVSSSADRFENGNCKSYEKNHQPRKSIVAEMSSHLQLPIQEVESESTVVAPTEDEATSESPQRAFGLPVTCTSEQPMSSPLSVQSERALAISQRTERTCDSDYHTFDSRDEQGFASTDEDEGAFPTEQSTPCVVYQAESPAAGCQQDTQSNAPSAADSATEDPAGLEFELDPGPKTTFGDSSFD